VLLSIDTSTLTLSLALVVRSSSGIQVLEHFTSGPPKKQSELLPAAIRKLLADHRVSLADLEGIAIGLGPGSFTGLRIGLSTAKGLSYAAKLPLSGVSSLAAIALEGPSDTPLFPTAAARQGELYVGEYLRRAQGVDEVGPERAIAPGELADLLRRSPEAVALGPGVSAFWDQLHLLGISERQMRATPLFPSAVAVAQLARLGKGYDEASVFAMEPHYVRLSPAETAALSSRA
jgi:tRNA threonylcarbamoyladenosine biosynthesis protein TsaB